MTYPMNQKRDKEWVIAPSRSPDDIISMSLEPCDTTDIDFKRSIVTIGDKVPTFEELKELSTKLVDPQRFLTVFTQCCMAEPVLFLRDKFDCHIVEIPDPMIYDVKIGFSSVFVEVHKTLQMFESIEDKDDAQLVRIKVGHVNFFKKEMCPNTSTFAEMTYFVL